VDVATPAEVWSSFCNSLKELGEDVLIRSEALPPVDQVAGVEQLASALAQWLGWGLNCSDPDFPRFGQVRDTPLVADYWYAAVRGDAEYRVTGNIAPVHDVNISVLSRWADGTRHEWGNLGRDELEVAPNGDFELVLSAEERPGNWLQLKPEAGMVMIREYFSDWTRHTPGSYEIVRAGSEGEAPPRPNLDVLASHLEWVTGFVRQYHRSSISRHVSTGPNTVARATPLAQGNAHIWYAFGSFELREDQALVIELEPASARLWTVQWLVSPWYANADVVNRLTSLVGDDARVDDDGRARIVLSASDCGAPNWLDIGGFDRGVIAARWLWSDEPPPVTSTVVDVGAVFDQLAPGTPSVGPVERAATVARRRSHFARRKR
jgi:hypothetical protein